MLQKDFDEKREPVSHPCEAGSNSVGHTTSPGATLNPSDQHKRTVPSDSNPVRMRRFTLFDFGDSYVDVPPMSRFLHIETNSEGKPVLVCQVDPRSPVIEWRRVVSVQAGSDRRRFAGWYGIPRQSGTNLWFLDPKVYDHNGKPVEPC